MNKKQLLISLKNRNISKQIINAFLRVNREKFIPKKLNHLAYKDIPLPIGHNQTISQPYTIAIMLEMLELKENQKVLEIGSGCGYVLSLIAEIVGLNGEVYGIEIIKELAKKAKENIKDYKNVSFYNRNGRKGLIEKAPFDRILISAACEKIPKTILAQLKNKGILVVPVGSKNTQDLVAIQKENNTFKIKNFKPGFVFVPFI